METKVHGQKEAMNEFVSFAFSPYFLSKVKRKNKHGKFFYANFHITVVWLNGSGLERSTENSRIWTNLHQRKNIFRLSLDEGNFGIF